MTITKIEPLAQKKNRIFIDGEYAFALYDRDIRMYRLEEEAVITPDAYDKIIKETVLRRAMQKSMTILERSDKTEAELTRKLKEGLYTDDIIDNVVAALTRLHYLDDMRFAENYVRNHASSMSDRELKNKLLQKGVSKDTIAQALDAIEEERSFRWEGSTGFSGAVSANDAPESSMTREQAAAVEALRKKLNGRTSVDYSTRRKAIAFMLRKGYKMNDISLAFDALGITFEEPETGDSTTSFFDLSDNF